jgi:branched-chain amino acid aminotransferase
MKAWINGEFVGWDRATVPILSHSFGRGSAIFEVLNIVPTVKGPAFFGLREHIDRFFDSADLVYMRLPLSRDELFEACLKTARENGTKRGGCKFFAYYPAIEFTAVPQNPQVDVAIFCVDFDAFGINQAELSKPVSVGVSKYRKLHPDTMPVHAKVVGNYVNSYLSLAEARTRGFDDVILIDTFGKIAEGATSSAFFVKEGRLLVPPLDNVLRGITRVAVIEIAKELGTAVEVRAIDPRELDEIDEAFFTVSLQHIMPMKSIEGRAVGKSCPGPVTAKIIEAVEDVYSGKKDACTKWLTYI